MVKMTRVEASKENKREGAWAKIPHCPAHNLPLFIQEVRLHKINGDVVTIAVVNACPFTTEKLDPAAHACGTLNMTPIAPKSFTGELWRQMQEERIDFRRFNCCEMDGRIVTYSTKHPHKREEAPLPPQDEHNAAKANAYQPEQPDF